MQATLVGAVTPALTVLQTQHLHLSPSQEPEIEHIHQEDPDLTRWKMHHEQWIQEDTQVSMTVIHFNYRYLSRYIE